MPLDSENDRRNPEKRSKQGCDIKKKTRSVCYLNKKEVFLMKFLFYEVFTHSEAGWIYVVQLITVEILLRVKTGA